MNKFVVKMLELGAELDKAVSPIEISMVINDAEIFYKNHIEKLTLTDVGSSFLWIVQDKESNILYTSFEKQKSIDRRIELIDKYKIPLVVNKILVD
tara:strand:- start:205 stop:492 length:288 start_codon:yes stop_codon:yes gene_type:complete